MADLPKSEVSQMPSPLRCFIGAILAGILAYGLYNMTSAIGLSFATKPISSDSLVVQRISSAVRTLVVGMSAMGTGIFGLATIGLFGLGIQLIFQKPQNHSKTDQ